MTAPPDLPERFAIGAVAGSGGMGTVYRAIDRTTSTGVAIKVWSGRAADEGRFEAEAEVLRRLSHPAIVGYVDHGRTASGALYLAMEWLDGEDLGRRLERGPLAVRAAITLGARVAEALASAHARGVVHRDIKPSNLLLVDGEIERVKVLDFGVARQRGAARETRTGATLGTPGYMAPEQARGARDVGPRADLFSLGCVLFECVTGRAAFVGEHAMALLAKVLIEETPRARELASEIPPALDALIARMMAKTADDRPADAASVAAELALIETVEVPPTVARPRATALGAAEQRPFCVVLAGWTGREAPVTSAGTPDTGESAARPSVRSLASAFRPSVVDEAARTWAEVAPVGGALADAAAQFGARIEPLADGFVAMLAGSGAATDQAARAARCALALRALLPDAAMSLATGRGRYEERWPVGEVIDRAAALLGSGAASTGIALDDVSAGLLDGRFDVRADAAASEPAPGAPVRPSGALPSTAAVVPPHGSTPARRPRAVVTRRAALALFGERELAAAPGTLLGKPTPCVGRERELGVLLGVHDECVAEPMARVVVITGAAGIGKSRLAHELLARLAARADPPTVWIGRGDPLATGAPLGVAAKLLRAASGILGGESPEMRQQRLRARLSRHLAGADLQRVHEFLAELSGAPFAASPRAEDAGATAHLGDAAGVSVQLRAARQDAILMGDQIRRAWEDFIAAEAAAAPLVILIDDLQWADVATVKMLDGALRAARESALMVLAVGRPELHAALPDLWRAHATTAIRLGELTRKGSEKLIRHALGAAVSPAVVTDLVERSAGNAFYLEELIRAVAEGSDELPGTVLAMAQARLAALEGDARRVLRAASVFGQTFRRGGVTALLGGAIGASGVDRWLAVLAERELIAPRDGGVLPGEAEFTIRHGLVRDAAYAMLTDEDRLLGHRLAGTWLAQQGDEEPGLLAEHFERGGDPARALGYYQRAAKQAVDGNDLRAAIALCHRGVSCGAEAEQLGALRLLEAEAHLWLGAPAETVRCAIEAMSLLSPGAPGSPVTAGTAAWFSAAGLAALASGRSGDPDGVERLAGVVRDRLAAGDRAAPALIAASRAAAPLLYASRYEQADALFAELDSAFGEAATDAPEVAGWVTRARAYRALHTGDAGVYLIRAREAAVAFEAAGDLRNACTQKDTVGYACLLIGAYAEAERAQREALAAAERLGLTRVVMVGKHNLGLTLARLGRFAEGRALEGEAIAFFAAQADARIEGFARIYLATILILEGDLGGAEVEARRAASTLSAIPGVQALASATIADALLRQGRPEDALPLAERAMATLRTLGRLEEGEARVHLVHAQALRASGSTDAAIEAIAVARDRLLAAAEKITDPDWRQSFLENVPDHAATLALAEAWTRAER